MKTRFESAIFILSIFISASGHICGQQRSGTTSDSYATPVALRLNRGVVFAGCDSRNSIIEVEAVIKKDNSLSTTHDVKTLYFAKVGQIVGVGRKATWDLSNVSPGQYSITVGADEGRGKMGDSLTRTISVLPCSENKSSDRTWQVSYMDVPSRSIDDCELYRWNRGPEKRARERLDLGKVILKGVRALFRLKAEHVGDINCMPRIKNVNFDMVGKFDDCPKFASRELCDGHSMKLLVTIETVDPENDPLTFTYKIMGGKIIGAGSKVIWDLSNEKSRHYAIEVCASDGTPCVSGVNIASAQVSVAQ